MSGRVLSLQWFRVQPSQQELAYCRTSTLEPALTLTNPALRLRRVRHH